MIKGPFSWAAVYFAAAAVTAIAQTTAPTAASQQNSGVDQAQIEQGKATFAEKCSHCHGPNMINAGTITPDLRRFPDDNGWIASRRFTPAGYRAGTRGPVYERVWRRADKPGRKRRWHVILKKRKPGAPPHFPLAFRPSAISRSPTGVLKPMKSLCQKPCQSERDGNERRKS